MCPDDIFDKNSDSALDDIVHGGYLGGDSTFDDLSIASRDCHNIYGQSSFRTDEETDREANGSVENTGVPGAIVVHSESKNSALAALVNFDPSGHPNQPSDYTPPSNPSERGGGCGVGADSGQQGRPAPTIKKRQNSKTTPERRPHGTFNIWLRETPCNQQFMESVSETCNMALENTVTGSTHFELAKTDVGGPR